jgi:hypothetical protein
MQQLLHKGFRGDECRDAGFVASIGSLTTSDIGSTRPLPLFLHEKADQPLPAPMLPDRNAPHAAVTVDMRQPFSHLAVVKLRPSSTLSMRSKGYCRSTGNDGAGQNGGQP